MLKAFLLLLLISVTNAAFACTTFLLKSKDQLFFGRNYDWITGEGVLNSNQSGLQKTSMMVKDGKAISWTSRFGSLTFNQYGKEFPTGGMNEKGLVVELMWLDGTKYPAKDDRAALNVLQWIQFQLDNHSTVAEVIASDSLVRIANGETPLHYLVADANGSTATIEFLNGKMVANTKTAFPVLTNHAYEYSFQQMLDGNARSNNSLERFETACTMLKVYEKGGHASQTPLDYSFDILKNVSQGNYTKWSIVYDIANKKIHFKTEGHADVKVISFSDVDLSCNVKPVSFNMNQDVKGEIKSQLVSYTSATNEKSLRTAFKESARYITVSEEEMVGLVNYAKAVVCK